MVLNATPHVSIHCLKRVTLMWFKNEFYFLSTHLLFLPMNTSSFFFFYGKGKRLLIMSSWTFAIFVSQIYSKLQPLSLHGSCFKWYISFLLFKVFLSRNIFIDLNLNVIYSIPILQFQIFQIDILLLMHQCKWNHVKEIIAEISLTRCRCVIKLLKTYLVKISFSNF